MGGQVMHLLGKMEGMLAAVLQRMDGIEQRIAADMQAMRHLINEEKASRTALELAHSARITNLETTINQSQGAAVATKVIIPKVWALILAIAGFVIWLVSSDFLGRFNYVGGAG